MNSPTLWKNLKILTILKEKRGSQYMNLYQCLNLDIGKLKRNK